MKTGALDDVLFPENPVADAPRIISRYKQLFPIESDSLLLGPMLELSFSQPPIVYVRLGLIFEVRNALGGDKPAELTKVILLGQLLVQLPPKELGVPAILKLLVDVVGFYDNVEKFLLIRARLRDSFVGHRGVRQAGPHRRDGARDAVRRRPVVRALGRRLPPGVQGRPARRPGRPGADGRLVRHRPAQDPQRELLRDHQQQRPGRLQDRGQGRHLRRLDPGPPVVRRAALPRPRGSGSIVQLEFQVKLEAFGESFASVTVRMSLEGPGEWRAKGYFSFGILWWDDEIGFDESWGSAPAVEPDRRALPSCCATRSATRRGSCQALPWEGTPSSRSASHRAGQTLAHPLGLITIAQKAVPLDVQIDRIGTKLLDEGKPTFSIQSVTVGGDPTTRQEPVTDHFARGQFMDLTEQQKLEGRSFETFTSGVRIGSTDYTVATAGTTVKADYEVEILEPEPVLNLHWKVATRFRESMASDVAMALVGYGAAASSARAKSEALKVDVGKAVDPRGADGRRRRGNPGRVDDRASPGRCRRRPSHRRRRCASGGFVVEAFEVASMTDTVYRFLPWSRRGLAAAIPGANDGAPMPVRAKVDIQVVVAGAGPVPTSTTLHGPGDIIGLDPTVIVRTIPRANSTNVEPNYLAAVDFDNPELPWLFTPTGVPSSGHLRPWLVLVVVRDRPGVSVTVPTGALLPRLKIDPGAASELPDLADSWAWAHVQLLDEDAGTTPEAVGKALADHPNRNVSRRGVPAPARAELALDRLPGARVRRRGRPRIRRDAQGD